MGKYFAVISVFTYADDRTSFLDRPSLLLHNISSRDDMLKGVALKWAASFAPNFVDMTANNDMSYSGGQVVLSYSEDKTKIDVYNVIESVNWWYTTQHTLVKLGYFTALPFTIEDEAASPAEKSASHEESITNDEPTFLPTTNVVEPLMQLVREPLSDLVREPLSDLVREPLNISEQEQPSCAANDAVNITLVNKKSYKNAMIGYTDELVNELKNFKIESLKKTSRDNMVEPY